MHLFTALFTMFVLVSTTLTEPQTIDITRAGARPVRPGPVENFTGNARVEMLFAALDPSQPPIGIGERTQQAEVISRQGIQGCPQARARAAVSWDLSERAKHGPDAWRLLVRNGEQPVEHALPSQQLQKAIDRGLR